MLCAELGFFSPKALHVFLLFHGRILKIVLSDFYEKPKVKYPTLKTSTAVKKKVHQVMLLKFPKYSQGLVLRL